MAEQADRLVGGANAVRVIDDTALPKKGTASVGLTPQYCGALGKQANCQSLVSSTLALREVPVPVGLRLFLPSTWTDDPARCAKAGVSEAARVERTKPQIALYEIDRLIAAGIRFGCVLADAGYGSGERKYYLSTLPIRTPLGRLAAAIKARWVCEQGHQHLKQELGLDGFEGRSWTGLHRHTLMTCIAFAYLQHLRLEAAGRGGKSGPQCSAATTNAS